LYVYIM